MELLCCLSLPWCQSEMTLEVPPGTDREGLLALLHEQERGADIFVFADEKMLLFGQKVPESSKILLLPVLSGG